MCVFLQHSYIVCAVRVVGVCVCVCVRACVDACVCVNSLKWLYENSSAGKDKKLIMWPNIRKREVIVLLSN